MVDESPAIRADLFADDALLRVYFSVSMDIQ